MNKQVTINVRFATVVEFLSNSKIAEKTFAKFEEKGYNDKLVSNGGVAIPNSVNFSWYKSQIKKFDITKADVDAWKKENKASKKSAEPKEKAKKASKKPKGKKVEEISFDMN